MPRERDEEVGIATTEDTNDTDETSANDNDSSTEGRNDTKADNDRASVDKFTVLVEKETAGEVLEACPAEATVEERVELKDPEAEAEVDEPSPDEEPREVIEEDLARTTVNDVRMTMEPEGNVGDEEACTDRHTNNDEKSGHADTNGSTTTSSVPSVCPFSTQSQPSP